MAGVMAAKKRQKYKARLYIKQGAFVHVVSVKCVPTLGT